MLAVNQILSRESAGGRCPCRPGKPGGTASLIGRGASTTPYIGCHN